MTARLCSNTIEGLAKWINGSKREREISEDARKGERERVRERERERTEDSREVT